MNTVIVLHPRSSQASWSYTPIPQCRRS